MNVPILVAGRPAGGGDADGAVGGDGRQLNVSNMFSKYFDYINLSCACCSFTF